jgi:hypothetical protein
MHMEVAINFTRVKLVITRLNSYSSVFTLTYRTRAIWGVSLTLSSGDKVNARFNHLLSNHNVMITSCKSGVRIPW